MYAPDTDVCAIKWHTDKSLNTRITNCLVYDGNLDTFADVCALTRNDIMELNNAGRKVADAILAVCATAAPTLDERMWQAWAKLSPAKRAAILDVLEGAGA